MEDILLVMSSYAYVGNFQPFSLAKQAKFPAQKDVWNFDDFQKKKVSTIVDLGPLSLKTTDNMAWRPLVSPLEPTTTA